MLFADFSAKMSCRDRDKETLLRVETADFMLLLSCSTGKAKVKSTVFK